MRNIFLFIVLLAIGLPAQSQEESSPSTIMLNTSVLFMSGASNISFKRQRSDLLINTSLFVSMKSFLIGATYDIDSEKWIDTGGSNDGTFTWKRQAWGPTAGYQLGRTYFHLTYYVSSQLEKGEPSGTVKYKRATGFQGTLGLKIRLFSWLMLAPQVSYKSFTYTQVENLGSTTDLTTNVVRTALDPYLSFWIGF